MTNANGASAETDASAAFADREVPPQRGSSPDPARGGFAGIRALFSGGRSPERSSPKPQSPSAASPPAPSPSSGAAVADGEAGDAGSASPGLPLGERLKTGRPPSADAAAGADAASGPAGSAPSPDDGGPTAKRRRSLLGAPRGFPDGPSAGGPTDAPRARAYPDPSDARLPPPPASLSDPHRPSPFSLACGLGPARASAAGARGRHYTEILAGGSPPGAPLLAGSGRRGGTPRPDPGLVKHDASEASRAAEAALRWLDAATAASAATFGGAAAAADAAEAPGPRRADSPGGGAPASSSSGGGGDGSRSPSPRPPSALEQAALDRAAALGGAGAAGAGRGAAAPDAAADAAAGFESAADGSGRPVGGPTLADQLEQALDAAFAILDGGEGAGDGDDPSADEAVRDGAGAPGLRAVPVARPPAWLSREDVSAPLGLASLYAASVAPATSWASPVGFDVGNEERRRRRREERRKRLDGGPDADDDQLSFEMEGATGLSGREDEDVHPAVGNGSEVLLQGFNWESHRGGTHYADVAAEAGWYASLGFTAVWLPPFTDSVSPQGYMPRDLYCLDSKYGSHQDLQKCVRTLQSHGLKALGDAVLNHRCAHAQDDQGTWNVFGGKLAWDQRAIVANDPHFRGRGNPKNQMIWAGAPNLDHSQDFVRRDLVEWFRWLRSPQGAGFDGFRLDFVRGIDGSHVRAYVEGCQPSFCVGEYWDALAYEGSTPHYNQDGHRQRIVDWIDAAGTLSTAFDMTTKGILHAVFERGEYWRLRDGAGRAPGLVGWWPSRAVTFLENHDTGSSQGHWRFPSNGTSLEQGYAYVLTHPGTPCVFYDHVKSDRTRWVVEALLAGRRRAGLTCRSALHIHRADDGGYTANCDGPRGGGMAVRLGEGTGGWRPEGDGWGEPIAQQHDWAVWAREPGPRS